MMKETAKINVDGFYLRFELFFLILFLNLCNLITLFLSLFVVTLEASLKGFRKILWDMLNANMELGFVSLVWWWFQAFRWWSYRIVLFFSLTLANPMLLQEIGYQKEAPPKFSFFMVCYLNKLKYMYRAKELLH